jgi:hypothetical protein
MSRVQQYNTRLIIHLAQTRIKEWANRTTGDIPHVDIRHQTCNILEAQLARDYMEKDYAAVVRMRTYVRANPAPGVDTLG